MQVQYSKPAEGNEGVGEAMVRDLMQARQPMDEQLAARQLRLLPGGAAVGGDDVAALAEAPDELGTMEGLHSCCCSVCVGNVAVLHSVLQYPLCTLHLVALVPCMTDLGPAIVF